MYTRICGVIQELGRLLGQSSVTATSAYLGVSDNSALELARSINVWGIQITVLPEKEHNRKKRESLCVGNESQNVRKSFRQERNPWDKLLPISGMERTGYNFFRSEFALFIFLFSANKLLNFFS